MIGQIDAQTITFFGPILALAGSILVAFLGATLLETRRQKRIRETEKEALRNALYNEIGWTVRVIILAIVAQDRPTSEQTVKKFFWTNWDELKTRVSEDVSTDVYDYTRTNPNRFYELEDAYAIEAFYRAIQELLKQIDLRAAGARDFSEAAGGRALPEDQGEAIHDFMHGIYIERLYDGIYALDIEKLRKGSIDWMRRQRANNEKRETESSNFIYEFYHELGGEEDLIRNELFSELAGSLSDEEKFAL